MKKYTIYIFLVISLTSPTCISQVIIYEPIGIMDKSLAKIYIQTVCNTDNMTNELQKCFVLDTYSLKSIAQSILKQQHTNPDTFNSATEYPFGSYIVTLISNGRKKQLLLSNKKTSHLFFKQQLAILPYYSNLYSEIQLIINRLK